MGFLSAEFHVFDLAIVILAPAMKVHRDIAALPPFSNAVITIGTFDGVHLGHKKIITALREHAGAINGESVLITFHPHPRKIISPGDSLQLLNTLEEKTELLSKAGIDHLVVVPFNKSFSEQTADQYIEDFLISTFHPHTIIIGYDHRFGKGREGDFSLLAKKADEYQYQLLEIPKYLLDEIAVSSTKIRNAILQSDVDTANKLLGYSFFFNGKVVQGDQLGRQLGYPTANLVYEEAEKIRLGHGVYAAYIEYEGKEWKAMLSVGDRPTLKSSDVRVEVNIFDFNKMIYGEQLKVVVKNFLRPQEKYHSLEELTAQLAKDKENSLDVL
jgi:riboflavin kinase / FMN adenylyltransferase